MPGVWATFSPFVLHYGPTSALWLNAVDRFFAKLTKRRHKRGVFDSFMELQAAMKRFLAETTDNRRPFVWTANPNRILAVVSRGYQALDSVYWAGSCQTAHAEKP